MISIKKAEDCCGCEACAQVCPKQCIKMTPNGEGFLLPVVDKSTEKFINKRQHLQAQLLSRKPVFLEEALIAATELANIV